MTGDFGFANLAPAQLHAYHGPRKDVDVREVRLELANDQVLHVTFLKELRVLTAEEVMG